MNVPLPGELLISNAMIIFFSKFFQRNIKVTLIRLSFFFFNVHSITADFSVGTRHTTTLVFFSLQKTKKGVTNKRPSHSLTRYELDYHPCQSGCRNRDSGHSLPDNASNSFPFFVFWNKNYQTKKKQLSESKEKYAANVITEQTDKN